MGRVRRFLFLLVGGCVLVLAGSLSSALAATSLVRVGAAPQVMAGSKVVGSLASTTRLGAVVTLEPRDPAALAAYATAVSTPGSSVYHHYLSVSEFRERFGPTAASISAVESSLRAQGLDPRAVTANGLAIPVAATTAGELAQAFSTSFERVQVPGGRIAFANTSAPALGANVAGDVEGVIGLDSLSLPHPLGLHGASPHARPAAVPRDVAALKPNVITGGPQPCATAQAASNHNIPGAVVYTADQVAAAYSYPSLYAAGDFGQGQTVALYELEGNYPADITAFQSCYGTDASVSYVPVDGGAPAPSGDDGSETELDIETVLGLAPEAKIIVYQGPNGGGSTTEGPYLTYSAIITADTAKVISASWGQCESGLGQSDADSEDTLFQEAATQGQSIFASAGDDGAETCYYPPYDSDDSLAVDDPASQPFVTAAGGAELSAIGPPPTETTWNDSTVEGGQGAGGGGISAFWPMPSYQSGAPASLNVINSDSSGSPCSAAAGGYCREVPDVSGVTSAESEYAIYWDGNGMASDSSAWFGEWGTSWAAPQLAALAAEANASSACSGTPIGFANPLLYRIAGSSDYANAFTDVTTGNNDYTPSGNTDGLYPAGSGYDMATGLGTPIATALAGYLCDHVTVANPGTQDSFAGTPVSVPVSGTSTGGATLGYTATGLPAGLSINASTGAVSGTPTTPGSSSVTVSVISSDGLSGSTSFTWNVLARVADVAGDGNQAGTVGVRVAGVQIHGADTDGGALSYTATGLPAGLSIGASSGSISGTPTTAGSSTVTVKVTDAAGPSATTTFTWVIAAAARFSKTSLSGVGKGKPKLSFAVAAATGAPSIKSILIGLPKGLSFSSKAKHLSKGIKLTAPGGKKFTARVSHGKLTISLTTPEPSVTVTISDAELSETKSLEKQVAHKHVKSLSVSLAATNAGKITTGAALKLGV
jgi:hypothetical protein